MDVPHRPESVVCTDRVDCIVYIVPWPSCPPIVGFWPPKPCTNPYPHPWNTLTNGKGMGLHQVRVKVGAKTPMGYPCPSLHWLYLKQTARKGTAGWQAPVPNVNDLPLRKMAIKEGKKPVPAPWDLEPVSTVPIWSSSPVHKAPLSLTKTAHLTIPSKPIPTEPRAYRLKANLSTKDSKAQHQKNQLGHCTCTPSLDSHPLIVTEEGAHQISILMVFIISSQYCINISKYQYNIEKKLWIPSKY